MNANAAKQRLHISTQDLLNCELKPAHYLYESELKWDGYLNYRSVSIIFTPGQTKTANFEVLKKEWYQLLIRDIPSYLYYLVPEQFAEALVANSTVMHKVELDPTLKTYIIETLEDMSRYNLVPEVLSTAIAIEVDSFPVSFNEGNS
ncbi:hypothetical protein M3649_20265 [Ureibacillus chungkukjangi]|nr:hypothetical protein [Ureibacillus chungkukjangi]MCM3390430.1 hypothetical protein [Ureibacillus chungkukjangi]